MGDFTNIHEKDTKNTKKLNNNLWTHTKYNVLLLKTIIILFLYK